MTPAEQKEALHAEKRRLEASNGRAAGNGAGGVTFTGGNTPKLVLPHVPAHDDPHGLAAWITTVFQLDPRHPATGAVHEGLRGQDGHVAILRAGAPSIRFEPAALISSARRLLPVLAWQLLPTDSEPYGFKDEHCRRIAYVLRLLCGASAALSEADETAGVVGTFLQGATAVEGHTTYGGAPQRYEAVAALQRDADERTGRPTGGPRYLIDVDTGELVIRVGDLQAAARDHIGSSLPRGWLDARMDSLGWQRRKLDGHAEPGRARHGNPHARADVYRGHLPTDDAPDETVR